MYLEFCRFKFNQKASPKKFCRYEIISNNPYDEKNDFKGNSIKYNIAKLEENKTDGRKMFIYVMNNRYLITYGEIKFIPELDNNFSLKLVAKDEIFPISEENLDLYSKWTEYFVYNKIVSYCSKNKHAYDYTKDNEYLQILNTPSNLLNVKIVRVFKVSAETLIDGNVYLSVNIRCEYESNNNVYDLIKNETDLTDLQVKCKWSYGTFTLKEILNQKINENIDGFNLVEYWKRQAAWRLKNIDLNAPAVRLYDEKKKRNGLYIPQSLFPVITREYIAKNDKKLSKEVDKYTKLSMKKRLEIIQEFLKVLDNFIDINPVPIQEFGYKEFNLASDMPNLLIANNKRIGFSEKYKAFNNGFYKLPAEPIVAAFMSYDNDAQKSHDVVQSILDYTRGKINGIQDRWLNKNMLSLRFYEKSFRYKKGSRLSYEETAHDIRHIPKINFAIAALPIEADEEDYYNDTIKSPYDSFKRVFADINIPSQMVSISMINDLGTKNISYRLQNIILGILSKSGGIPWILESPMDDVDCFIGLDVGTQEKGIHYPACSVCLDGRGNLIGYYSTNVAQSGEKIDRKSLETIFNSVLRAYREEHGEYPKHIVIHRDGFSNEENEWYINYFKSSNIKFDLVEIRKNISVRLLDTHQVTNEMNPSSGFAVLKDNEAYIITTDVKPFLGAPRPLSIVHRHGDLSIEQIVRQIYVLSEMHVGSMRTSRLPLTTLYADKICKHHDHVPHDTLSDKLYFL